jgi:4-hydroxy-tetrahydrodipicolinate reductase
MGKYATQFLMDDPSFEVVGLVDRRESAHSVSPLAVEVDLESCLKRTKPDVTLIFSSPRPAGQLAHTSVTCGVPTVIGSSGVDAKEMEALKVATATTPCLMVPNFSIGAVLMMQFVKMAASHFPDAEIVEYHNENELNSPSGTAFHTAKYIAAARTGERTPLSDQTDRGSNIDGVVIHSVRLPGLEAHQEVLFGAKGELLTIRHDTLDVSSFETGIKLCLTKVGELKGFVVGMENLL